MCGRARCTLRVEDVGRAVGFRAPLRTLDAERFRPSYNMPPGRYMPVVRHAQVDDSTEQCSTEPVVHCMKWGLIPSFTKKNEKPDHFRMFNARSESVHLKSSFNRLLKRNRCVTSVEGFYEWKKDGPKKQPYYLHFEDGRPLVFAALYDSWKDDGGNVIHTFTILTTRVSKALGWLHDRMPVILPNEESVSSWLNDELSEPSIHKLTQPYEGSDLVWYPVTTEMGKPSYDVPECVQEIKPKVAKDSQIFQLFGKKKALDSRASEPFGKENPNADDKEQSSQTTEFERQEVSEEGRDSLPLVEQDDDMQNEEEKALVPGLEPDQDVIDALQRDGMDALGGSQEESNTQQSKHISDVTSRDQKDEVSESRLHISFSSTGKNGTHDLPDAKRRHLSVSPKKSSRTMGKGVKKVTVPEKQSSLLSFFGRT